MSSTVPPTAAESLPELHNEVTRVCEEIAVAASEDALYTGGLVKSLIAVRLQVMRTTKALIEQRIQAIKSGAPITLVTQAITPDEPRARQLEAELRAQSELLQQARAEAASYAGGLVHSLKLSIVATHEQTMANLRQHFLMAKYGLVLPVQGINLSGSPGSNANTPTQKAVEDKLFEIIKVDARVTEANQSWSRYAWQITIQSLAKVPLRLEAKIEFQDSNGFIIADATEYGLNLAAGAQDTFGGYSLITAEVADNVRTVAAKVKAT